MSEEKKTGKAPTEIAIRKGKTEVTHDENVISVSAPSIIIQKSDAVAEGNERINWNEAFHHVTAQRKGGMK